LPYVLVVDDDPDVREVFRESLLWAGHTPAVVGSIATARQLVALKAPDVVILDLHFPDDGDALTFAEEIRAVHDVPVLACSGDPDLLQQARRSGVFATVIPKPCDVLAMVRAVTEVVQR
jgi:CheY-like chemotaxis protein